MAFNKRITEMFFQRFCLNILLAFFNDLAIERFSLAIIGNAKWKTKIKYIPGSNKNTIPNVIAINSIKLNSNIFQKCFKLFFKTFTQLKSFLSNIFDKTKMK